ncbi:Protein CBG28053 [Caenorhabditis briggsae]|uniref:Protein CBG28053 n=1 Tax=Caenorhabditis briggsae TaxID=6238 RepID=B6IGP3_CAEBR|nr:Protein CBG28053 [Caenorhabditis briggsae]CAR99073.1 Protein CBG28053 [Caenorhabditis briggsae]
MEKLLLLLYQPLPCRSLRKVLNHSSTKMLQEHCLELNVQLRAFFVSPMVFLELLRLHIIIQLSPRRRRRPAVSILGPNERRDEGPLDDSVDWQDGGQADGQGQGQTDNN